MSSLFDLVQKGTDLVCLAGRKGLSWKALRKDLGLENNTSVATFLLQRLKDSQLTFSDAPLICSAGKTFDDDITIIASTEDFCRAIGINSLFDLPHDPYLSTLECLANARESGLTLIEAGKILKTTPNTLHPTMEKLNNLKLLVKSCISPVRGAIKPRNANRILIYHLKRFFPFYRPEDEEMTLSLDETASFRMENVIINLMEQHGVTKMWIKKLRYKLGNYDRLKRLKLDLKAMISILKNKSRLVMFTDTSQSTRKKSLRDTPIAMQSIGLKCIHGTSSESDEVPAVVDSTPQILTVQNLAMYEQIVDRLNLLPGGVPSNQLSSMVGLSSKKTLEVMTILSESNLGFSLRKVRNGKSTVSVLLGNNIRVSEADLEEIKKQDQRAGYKESELTTDSSLSQGQKGGLVLSCQDASRRELLSNYLDQLGGICDSQSFAMEIDRQMPYRLSKTDKRTSFRMIEEFAKGRSLFFKDISMVPYKLNVSSLRILLSRETIERYRGSANTDSEAVDMATNHYLRKYYIPWRKLGHGRGFLADFITSGCHSIDAESSDQMEQEPSKEKKSPATEISSAHKAEDTSLAEGEVEDFNRDSEPPWVSDRKVRPDVFDKFLKNASHMDALKSLLVISPDFCPSRFTSLNMNDIQSLYLDAAKNRSQPEQMSMADFIGLAKSFHMEIFRQMNKERSLAEQDESNDNATCKESVEDNSKATKKKSCDYEYTFTLEKVLSRLSVRSLIRNYGLPRDFRDTVTNQFADKRFVHEGEICYEHRVLVHAAQHMCTSVDSLLKSRSANVRDLAWKFVAAAMEKANKLANFLCDLRCISNNLSHKDGADYREYIFVSNSKPHGSLKLQKKLKDVESYWDTFVTSSFVDSDDAKLDLSTGHVLLLPKMKTPKEQVVSCPLRVERPVKRKKSSPASLQPDTSTSSDTAVMQSGLEESKERSERPTKARRDKSTKFMENYSVPDDYIVSICRLLWNLFLPIGLPDVLKCTKSPNDLGLWYHPHRHVLPVHKLSENVNIGYSSNLLAGGALQRKTNRLLDFLEIEHMDLNQIESLKSMVIELVAASPHSFVYLCEHFESVFLDDVNCKGSDVLSILNDLVSKPTARGSFPSPILSACMTRVLQVYLTHPLFDNALAQEVKSSESEASELIQLFYSNLCSLRSLPLDLVVDVHRELYVKKVLRRRQNSDETDSKAGLLEVKDAFLLSGGFEFSPNFLSLLFVDPAIFLFTELLSKSNDPVMLRSIGSFSCKVNAKGTANNHRVTNCTDRFTELNAVSNNSGSLSQTEMFAAFQEVNKFIKDECSSTRSDANQKKRSMGTLQLAHACRLKTKKVKSSSDDPSPSSESKGFDTFNVDMTLRSSREEHRLDDISEIRESPDERSSRKTIGAVHSGYGADGCNSIVLNLPSSIICAKPIVPVPLSHPSGDATETSVPSNASGRDDAIKRLRSFLLECCGDMSGVFFSDIVSHVLSSSSDDSKIQESFSYDIKEKQNRYLLERDIGDVLNVLTTPSRDGSVELCELPVFTEQYEQSLSSRLFVLPAHVSHHTVDLSTVEGGCPWMMPPKECTAGALPVSGSRNQQAFNTIVAKVLTILYRQPRSTISQIHSELSHLLNVTQMCILMQVVIDAGLVKCFHRADNSFLSGAVNSYGAFCEQDATDIFFDESHIFTQNHSAIYFDNDMPKLPEAYKIGITSFGDKVFLLSLQ